MRNEIYGLSLFKRLNDFLVQKIKKETNMKRLKKIALALALGLGLAHVSQAAVTDQLVVTITPNAYYSVAIDTANVVLDLGTVALTASTQTVRPSTVTILSTFATTDLRLQGAITSAGTPWTFDRSEERRVGKECA